MLLLFPWSPLQGLMPESLLHYSAITGGGLGGLRAKNDETESDVGSDVTIILLLLRALAPRHQLNLEIGENQEEPEQCSVYNLPVVYKYMAIMPPPTTNFYHLKIRF